MRAGLAPILVLLCAACAFAPFAGDTAEPTPAPSTADPTEKPTTAPTADASPGSPDATDPDASPTDEATPEPTPDPAALDLRLTGCNGGVVLQWSPSRDPDFSFYIGLRSPERRIAPQYPPIAPAVDWGDLYATDPFVTSGYDATVIPSTTVWHYRVMAYDVAGAVVGSTPVRSARIHPRVDLGPLGVGPAEGAGRTRLTWKRFNGLDGCFSSYRVLYGTGGFASTVLTTISEPGRTELETGALHPGTWYTLRVQAVRTTTLGHFVVGETEPVGYLVPAPEP
jgi:hypothetical protein